MKFNYTKTLLSQVFSLFLTTILFLLQSCDNSLNDELTPLPKLTISDIKPLKARATEKIVITGTGFDHEYPSRNKVYFTSAITGNTTSNELLIKKATPTELTVIVERGDDQNENNNKGSIMINVRGKEIMSEQHFELDLRFPNPQITSITPSEGIVNSVIEIVGRYFDTDYQGNKYQPSVLLGTEELATTEVKPYKGKLSTTFTIPKGLTPGSHKVKIKHRGLESEPVNFKLSSPPQLKGVFWTSEKKIYKASITEESANIEVLYNTDEPAYNNSTSLLDSQRGLIYWITDSTDSYKIHRATLDGNGVPEEVFSIPKQENELTYTLNRLSLDARANKLYFAVAEKKGSGRKAKRKGLLYQMDLQNGQTNIFATILDVLLRSIKIDTEAQNYYCYATKYNKRGRPNGYAVFKGSLQGGTPQKLYDDITHITALAINPSTRGLYISNLKKDIILKGTMDGGKLSPFIELEVNNKNIVLDSKNGFLFFNDANIFKRANLDGTDIITLFNTNNTNINVDINYFDVLIE
ncbi:MAG: IPT/TIG domain-containing protein [Tenacibaculum sp.]